MSQSVTLIDSLSSASRRRKKKTKKWLHAYFPGSEATHTLLAVLCRISRLLGGIKG
jgi:hypothetical protein